jgi:hypothetical protein
VGIHNRVSESRKSGYKRESLAKLALNRELNDGLAIVFLISLLIQDFIFGYLISETTATLRSYRCVERKAAAESITGAAFAGT